MTRQISDRQAAILLCMGIVSLKFLILPALLSRYSYHDSYWSIIIALLIDFIFFIIILWVLKRFPHLTFTEIIDRAIGSIARKSLNFIMFAYFFIKGILIIKETHNYFNETLFENITWPSFIFPFFLIIFFIMLKDLKSIARSVEFYFVLIIGGIIFSVLVPAGASDFSNLLPLFDNGVGGVFKGLFYCNFSFGDYFVLMLMMGRIDIKAKSISKIIKYIIAIDILVIAFYVLFATIFGTMGSNQILALSDMPLHTTISSSIGRLDWIVIIVWTITLIFQAGILFSMSCHCLNDVVTFKNKYVPAFTILVLMILSVVFLYLDLAKAVDIVTSLPFSIISVVVQVAVPIIVLFCALKLKNKNVVDKYAIIKQAQIKLQYTEIKPSYKSNLYFKISKNRPNNNKLINKSKNIDNKSSNKRRQANV